MSAGSTNAQIIQLHPPPKVNTSRTQGRAYLVRELLILIYELDDYSLRRLLSTLRQAPAG